MTALTYATAQQLLAALLAQGTFTPPTELWLALHTADPGEAGSLADEVDDSGTGYLRMEVTALLSAVSATGSSVLLSAVTFPDPTGEWGTPTHASLCDAGTVGTGNVLLYGPIDNPRYVTTGEDPIEIPAASLSFGLT
jgi:hypothetical protein